MGKIDAEVPTDLLAGLLMERAGAPAPRRPETLTAKVYGVMALTSLLTFAALVTAYQLLFAHQLFA